MSNFDYSTGFFFFVYKPTATQHKRNLYKDDHSQDNEFKTNLAATPLPVYKAYAKSKEELKEESLKRVDRHHLSVRCKEVLPVRVRSPLGTSEHGFLQEALASLGRLGSSSFLRQQVPHRDQSIAGPA